MTHNLCTRKKSNIDYCHSKKILITPRIYLNTIEQIEMLKEDYLSFQNNFYHQQKKKIISIESFYKRNIDLLKNETVKLHKDFKKKINDSQEENLKLTKDCKEHLVEINRLNTIINKDCNLIGIDDIQDFHCPISWDIFKDPVVLEDGFTYEREYISEWLSKYKRSPNTNRKIINKKLIPNQNLKNIISLYQEIVVSLNQHKQEIKESQDVIQLMIKEIESLSLQKDLLLETLNEIKPKKKCFPLFS